MFCLNDTMRYFLCPGKTDMRKGINSLCGLVHDKMGYDVRLGDVFKSGKTKSDTYQKRKAIFGAKTKSDENNKGDTRNSIAFIITLMMGYTFKSNFTFSSPANNCCVFPILFS